MSDQRSAVSSRVPTAMLFILAGVIFWTGINWGLPSRAVDRFLFGETPVWSGRKIQELAGGWSDDPGRGADVDADPLHKSNEPVLLNETDAQRAEIVRRYRLYTYQPDEMITLRALAGMRPSEGRLDPRLYQYGGLWIYPVGALLKLASSAGLVTLKADVPWYLDHPEEFGRLYVVARLYAAGWGLVGLWAVYWIARRLTGGKSLPALFAGLCYACMPVVINMAHEAKPHLPGAVLQLLAIMAAMRYVETGRRGWWLLTAVLCGAAFGMVLSAWPVFIVLPVMVLLRPEPWRRRVGRVIGGVPLGVAVYLATNPYIVINLFINRAVLRSNFGNSLSMYAVGRWPAGVANAARLVAEGASVSVAVIGSLAVVIAAIQYLAGGRKGRAGCPPAGGAGVPPASETLLVSETLLASEATAQDSHAEDGADLASDPRDLLLLAAPVVLILLQFVALAAGKPGEYGRFAVLPDVALGLAAVVGISRTLPRRGEQAAGLVMLLLLVAIPGYGYLRGFIADSGDTSSRLKAGSDLFLLGEGGARTLAVYAEPAPYILPPVNLFTWRILLMPERERPETGPCPADVAVRVVDDPGRLRTRISWADKAFDVWEQLPPDSGERPVIGAPRDGSF